MAHYLDKVIPFGLLATIVFTALTHGAVEPWSIAIFELAMIILLIMWTVKAFVEKQVELNIPLTAYPIAGFLIFSLIQSISITTTVGGVSSLSIDPESTRTASITLLFLLAAHLIAANFFNSVRRLNAFAAFLITFGFIMAFIGLFQMVAGNGKLMWFREFQIGSQWANGPFVNHNHYAGYLELIIPLPVALIITKVRTQYHLLYAFAAIMMATALILSVSRAGMISLGASFLFTLLLGLNYNGRVGSSLRSRVFQAENRHSGRLRSILSGVAIFVVMIAAVLAGVIWMGLGPVVTRVADNNLMSSDEKAETFESSRGWIWKTTEHMIRANPVSGVGLGAFTTAYPIYSDRNETQIVERAHNDYLQVLADTGVIGGILGLWFLLTFAYNVVRILKCVDPLVGAIAIGSAGGIFSLLIHSMFDFNLQIMSTALLFLVLNAVLSLIVFSSSAAKVKRNSIRTASQPNEDSDFAFGVSS